MGRARASARRPCFSAFWRAFSLPSLVFGPVEREAFLRLICFRSSALRAIGRLPFSMIIRDVTTRATAKVFSDIIVAGGGIDLRIREKREGLRGPVPAT